MAPPGSDSGSEYDAAFEPRSRPGGEGDLEEARKLFGAASRPYLSSPLPWLVWALLLPGAALATEAAFRVRAEPGVLALWALAVFLGGCVEGFYLLRARRRLGTTPLGAWAMTVQGNLSLVAVAFSAVAVVLDRPRLLPGIWLLLLGHSLFALGGLAFRPLRTAGVVYQLGGAAALLPGVPELVVLALATGLGNLRVALGLLLQAPAPPGPAGSDRG